MHNFSLTCTTSNWRAQLPPNMQWTASSSECRWCCWKSLGPLFSSPSSKGRAGILCKHNGTVWNTMKHDDIVCTMMKHENTWKPKKNIWEPTSANSRIFRAQQEPVPLGIASCTHFQALRLWLLAKMCREVTAPWSRKMDRMAAVSQVFAIVVFLFVIIYWSGFLLRQATLLIRSWQDSLGSRWV